MFQCLSEIPKIIDSDTKCIIMLHGIGSNEQDLFKIAAQFPREYALFSLRAPATLGFGRYAWYPVDFSKDEPKYELSDVQSGIRYIEEFIDEVKKKYELNSKNIILLGFSQGAIMSLYTLYHSPERIAGVISLSGRLLSEISSNSQKQDSYADKKLFIGHGNKDSIIPVEEVTPIQEFFTSVGVNCVNHIYPMGHTISPEEVDEILKWI